MWFFDWIWDLLISLGFSSSQPAKILFLGLDNAGKTTLIHLLTTNSIAVHNPTVHPTSQTITLPGTRITLFAHDLGGHRQARRLWRDYFMDVSGIIFLVDTADRERIPEARAELEALLSMDELSGVPFCVLGNKVDDMSAIGDVDELKEVMGLGMGMGTKGMGDGRWGGRAAEVGVFMCSVVKRVGYQEGFRWLSKNI